MSKDHPFIHIQSLAKPSISAASLKLLKQRRKERGKNANLTIPDGIPEFVHTSQNAAVQNLLTVIAHSRTLFAGEFAEKEGLIARLKELESAAHEVELGVYKHGFPCDRHYEEYEELCSLENTLNGFYEPDWKDNLKNELLLSLIGFWLDEIKNRGNHLFNLLIGSVEHKMRPNLFPLYPVSKFKPF